MVVLGLVTTKRGDLERKDDLKRQQQINKQSHDSPSR
jgi:hypothetical protein